MKRGFHSKHEHGGCDACRDLQQNILQRRAKRLAWASGAPTTPAPTSTSPHQQLSQTPAPTAPRLLAASRTACTTAVLCPHSVWSQAQGANNGPTRGLVVPGCLDGSADTVELCRRENDGLVPTIQFFRNRQNNSAFQYNTSSGLQKLSLADIIVGAAATAVKQCSGGALVIPHTVGRPEATVADEGLLPSP